MSDKVRIKYKGKTYYRLADLAHDYNIDSSLVSSRWHNGHRKPEELVKKGKLNTIQPYAHQITYEGTTYKSAREFSRKYNLIYGKVLRLMKKGVVEPEKLIDNGKSNQRDSIDVLTAERKADEAQKTRLIHVQGLLTVQEVSQMTQVPVHPISVLANGLITGRKKAGHLGLKKSDIVRLNFKNEEDRKKIKNEFFIGKYGFKKIAVNHILERINIIKDRDMEQLPDPFSKYYYDLENKEVWKYSSLGYGTVRLRAFTKSKSFVLMVDKKRFKFSPDTIEDIVKHPEITYQDLITKQDIIAHTDLTTSRWNNLKISKYLPLQHTRYDKIGSKVSGWTKEEYDKACKTYPEKLSPLYR